MKKIYGLFRYIYTWIITFDGINNTRFMSYEETVSKVVTNNLSVIRWGDGETDIIRGVGIHYQMFSPELRKELITIINDYNKQTENSFLFCLPIKYLKMNVYTLFKTKMWGFWTNTRWLYKRLFNQNNLYGDAFLFGKGKNEAYSKLWNNVKYIIFVHSNRNCFENYNKSYPGKISFFVQISSENCYSDINTIEEKILTIVNGNILNTKNLRILISAGPTGKALAYRLIKKDLIVYDTGHCWDYPLID